MNNLFTEINLFIDEQRSQCFWFIREDWYPSNKKERLSALNYIKRSGNVKAFRKASELEKLIND